MTVTSPTRRPVRPAQRATRPRPAVPTRAGLGRRLRLRGTPGRLRAVLVGLVLLGLGAGLAGVIGVEQRSGLVDEVSTSRGPLTVQAQGLYRSLSDADATAAAAFLSAGTEPPALRTRYLDDIAAATKALAAVAASGVDAASVRELSSQLPSYTGLVETARVYNRQGMPLGSAYLREASGLMRQRLLPAAQRLYKARRRSPGWPSRWWCCCWSGWCGRSAGCGAVPTGCSTWGCSAAPRPGWCCCCGSASAGWACSRT
jgi:hypothetical protein